MKGTKYDKGKLQWDKMHWNELEEVMAVMQHGAEKYDWNNYLKVPDAKARYTSALFRHLIAVQQGSEIDPESKFGHYAHAICNILFLMRLEVK